MEVLSAENRLLKQVIKALQGEYSISDQSVEAIYQDVRTKNPDCGLLHLPNELLILIFTFVDVTTHFVLRKLCRRICELSKGMRFYWVRSWEELKGPTAHVPVEVDSCALWTRERKWMNLCSQASVSTLCGHNDIVTAVATFSHKKKKKEQRLISASFDGSLVVWSLFEEANSSSAGLMQQHHRQVKSVSRLHSLNGHHGVVSCLSVDDKEVRVASGSFDNTVKIWDLSSGNCLHTLRGHENWLSSVHMKDQLVVSASYDGTIKVWQFQPEGDRYLLPVNLLNDRNQIVQAVDRFDHRIVASSTRNFYEDFDLESLQRVHVMPSSVKTLSLHVQDAFTVCTGSNDGVVRIWDLRTSNTHQQPALYIPAHRRGSSLFSVKLGSSTSSPHRLVTGSSDQLIKVFDTRFPALSTQTLSLHSEAVFCVCQTEDLLISGSADKSIKIVRTTV